MTEERRKEIALKLVEQKILDEGLPGKAELKQRLGNIGKQIDVSTEELLAFYQTFMPKLYGKVFGYRSVRIEANNS